MKLKFTQRIKQEDFIQKIFLAMVVGIIILVALQGSILVIVAVTAGVHV